MAAKPGTDGRNNAARTDRIDPTWPGHEDGEHPLTELLGPVQGNMSPFGEVTFPLPSVPYEHPVTEINR
ncbi:hypothetical protein [Pseudonocardia phyllosphaerae]|uniref:hypothetical protein n=1 Tax=Pseudonocardia phyllosphaerae TaxID=3390502 RepID=UPI00397CA396